MKRNAILFLAALAVVLAPTLGIACDKHSAETVADANGKPGCAKSAADKAGCNKAKAEGAALAANGKPGCNKAKAEGAALVADGKPGCNKNKAEAAALAANAEAGCAKSTAALVAMAKDSGCEKTAALAAKAESGDKEAEAELIATIKKYYGKSSDEKAQPTMAQLATWAENGCAKSATQLIARAKDSGCSKTAALAANAEAGCEKSKAALIALAKVDEDEEDSEKVGEE